MIEFGGVIKKYDDFTALDNVSFTVPEGSAFGLLGSNGAGKSTILRILSGIYNITDGKALIDGEKIYNNAKIKQEVFFINDETVQFGKFTLTELKNFYKGFYPDFSEDTYRKLVDTIKLPENKRIDSFSKGMKRQAIVIVGLSCKTKYLLLDEAFDGLDPTMRIIVKHMLIDEMIDRKLTVIISSHNLTEINEVCDTAILLHEGKVLFCRELDSIKGDIHKVQTAFRENHALSDFDFPEIIHSENNMSVFYFIMRGSEEEIREKFKDFEPVVFDILPLTLEEIFIYEMEALGYDANGIN